MIKTRQHLFFSVPLAQKVLISGSRSARDSAIRAKVWSDKGDRPTHGGKKYYDDSSF